MGAAAEPLIGHDGIELRPAVRALPLHVYILTGAVEYVKRSAGLFRQLFGIAEPLHPAVHGRRQQQRQEPGPGGEGVGE